MNTVAIVDSFKEVLDYILDNNLKHSSSLKINLKTYNGTDCPLIFQDTWFEYSNKSWILINDNRRIYAYPYEVHCKDYLRLKGKL